MPKARDYVNDLVAGGRYHFTLDELRNFLGGSPAAARLAANRLAKQRLIASPARSFYMVVPPEYQRLGSLPADQFIPALMAHRITPYYAELLSAAQYHGAAHHRPQEFQVMLTKNRRAIQCGAVRVTFFARKRLREVPTQSINTPRGTIVISTAEATAIDLVGYEHHAGGLDNVATLLSELADQIDPLRLVDAAKTAPISWAQRLGYLLELVDAPDRVSPLKHYVRETARDTTPLLPAHPHENAERVGDWHLLVNTKVEAEV